MDYENISGQCISLWYGDISFDNFQPTTKRQEVKKMNAIILTGGRGRRLGALTTRQPKATLCFADKSLLAHTLSSLRGSENLIDHIYVATGYRADKIMAQYQYDAVELSSKVPVTLLPVEAEPSGTFGSVAWALHTAGVTKACLILGVDVIITKPVMAAFIASVQNEMHATFVVSPILSIAPTHGRIRLSDIGDIVEYRKSSLFAHQISQSGWYCDVGVRYFSADFVRKCQLLSLTNPCDFDDVVPSMVDGGQVFKAYISNERWLHFGNSRDFLQEPL